MANKQKPAAQPEPQPAQTPKMSFDIWWAMVEKKIPPQHRKEIISADFKARGLKAHETSQAFHQALATYGVKLK